MITPSPHPRAKVYDFDGEQLTLRQIKDSRLSCYITTAILKHIQAGRNTTALVLGYHHGAAKSRNGRACALKSPYQIKPVRS